MSEPKTIDKSKWGQGPWQREPDRVEWSSQGVPCLMRRHPSAGHWCGYVAVPPGHPWHQKDFAADWDLPDPRPEVHGGITYAAECDGPICHVPAPGEPDNVWWLGFDCAHSGDLSPGYSTRLSFESYKAEEYVRTEVEALAKQARELERAR